MNGTKRKWVAYGVAGAVGLVVIGGGAAATAANMNLRSTDGQVVPGGAVTGPSGNVLDRAGVTMTTTDTSASVVSSASPTPTPSAPSPASPAT
ncbi:hypothetical protein, partial [Microbacterium sp. Marseille-Q6648]|uniref:hypothetical protein n=1 Tax=Microbacterium sp. Marseille-Q6648 TaxID=2937991 RepID=UPI00203F6763